MADLNLRDTFQVAYIGEDPNDHLMEVDELAPCLLAFGKLLRAANADLNKDEASVKLFVASEFEHKCFAINFELVQTILRQITDFFASEDVKDATELLKTIGVYGGFVGATIQTVFKYLSLRKGRKVDSVQQVPGSPTVIVKFEGDHNHVHVNANVYTLSNNPQILDAIEQTLSPVQDKKARAVEFRKAERNGVMRSATLEGKEVVDIIASCEASSTPIEMLPPATAPRTVTATLYVYGPVFDVKAQNWRFRYRRKHIYADISETDIARNAVARGTVSQDDRYRVRMEVVDPVEEGGTTHYKIIEVLEFKPADEQLGLPLRNKRHRKSRKRKAA